MGGSSSKKVACAPAEEGADAGDGAGAGDASAPAAGDEAGEEDDDDWEYDEGGGDETDAERSRRRYANAKASTKNVKEFCEKLGIRTTERSKLRALFDAHDKMHADGLVDIAEFCRGSEMNSLPFMHRVFDAMDTDEHLTAELAEGKLDYHEFLIGVYNFCALPGGDYLAKLLFDMYDTDISGWLSAAQYRAMGEDLMLDRAQDALLARTDLDANGRVTFKEFRNGCRKCREEGVESPYDRALRYQAALRARATEVAPGWWDEQAARLERRLSDTGLWSAREYYNEEICGWETPRADGEMAGDEKLYMPGAKRRAHYPDPAERAAQKGAEKARRAAAGERAAAEDDDDPTGKAATKIQKAERGKQARAKSAKSKDAQAAHLSKEKERQERKASQVEALAVDKYERKRRRAAIE